eukprot:CAMPEP_0116871124 /NCGR_PEP_ID=MMETSP0463-20121206/1343_1 /TAXON_ID=181622 /ORGANISM="Strombidinopsis sp, Strain SopsisLIS2011" /LENGTH=116 /DNA_ID=CAMNT_0004508969 /DNA_START=3254 /DNA_END=3604 /DNA_ORIENTATION=+
MNEYKEKFYAMVEDSKKDNISMDMAEILGKTLVKFDNDDQKPVRIQMAEQLEKKIVYNEVKISAKFLDNLIYIYTESQQWSRIKDLLMSRTSENTEKPSSDTISYMKKNLMYCFDA